MISLIAAVGKNNEIGIDNHLLWNLKGDMSYFKKTTTNHIVVMGKKTYDSIGKPLPNRKNIVITHSHIDSVITLDNIETVLDLSKNEEIFIIGGASIYNYFIDYADIIYLTEIEDTKNADSYFPNFDKSKYSKSIIESLEENGIKYSFVKYKKIKSAIQ